MIKENVLKQKYSKLT